MRRPDADRIREAKEAGEAARLGRIVPPSDRATRLGSTPGPINAPPCWAA